MSEQVIQGRFHAGKTELSAKPAYRAMLQLEQHVRGQWLKCNAAGNLLKSKAGNVIDLLFTFKLLDQTHTMNNPVTRSCITLTSEKQIVVRASRLMRVLISNVSARFSESCLLHDYIGALTAGDLNRN